MPPHGEVLAVDGTTPILTEASGDGTPGIVQNSFLGPTWILEHGHPGLEIRNQPAASSLTPRGYIPSSGSPPCGFPFPPPHPVEISHNSDFFPHFLNSSGSESCCLFTRIIFPLSTTYSKVLVCLFPFWFAGFTMAGQGMCFFLWLNGPLGKVQCINTEEIAMLEPFFPRPLFCISTPHTGK